MAAGIGIGERMRRVFVPMIDRSAPLGGPLAEAGGALAIGTFPPEELELYLGKLAQAMRYRLSRREIRELLRKLAPYGVRALLNSYLGPLWSADYAVIWRSSQQSTSGEWHHDNVGNRVKLFVVLANDSDGNGTEFITHTHATRWRTFTGRLPPPERNGSLLRQRRGDMLVFDTNLVHRGRYSAHERIILQLEFSNILKSFVVFGQCGRFLRSRFERGYGAAG
jgi:hypothetical protein